ncbi:flippase-like domain-containing protein [Candidatus Saccharibacteria bacterium]|nr:flippase-like domain-containing protein [Candidatus Saccharibacteria bacterium]
MAKKHVKFSIRTILLILTAILVIFVINENWHDIDDTINYLGEANGFVLALLVPEQLFMYYACGQIFFSYLRTRPNVRKFTKNEVMLISTELNFVNHAVPAGGLGGLAFITYRLSPFNVSAGQASFLYLFRYAITTVINYLQALIAILLLLGFGLIPDEAIWVVPVALIMNLGVGTFLWFVVHVASNEKRIDFFAKTVARFTSGIIKTITFGKRKYLIRSEKISNYFTDIQESIAIAKNHKKYLKAPILWGLMYSFLEVATYWLVAISLGRPELLAYIMVGEAIGSVFDGIVPYGLYELGMAGVMIALGVDFPTATIVTVMTRVVTLVLTLITGSVPYYRAIKEKQNATRV